MTGTDFSMNLVLLPYTAAPAVGSSGGEVQWCFSQVKGALDDDVTEGK